MMTVRWTDDQRAVEAELGIEEIRARMSNLHPDDLYEVLVAFARPVVLTPQQASQWAEFATTLTHTGSGTAPVIRVDGCRILRLRTPDELAWLVVVMEMSARASAPDPKAATPGRPEIINDEEPGTAEPLRGKAGARKFLAEMEAAGEMPQGG